MQINYMKLIVYILTFIGYCYSGYGSGILSGVRDAILTFETLFSGVFGNFIKITRKLHSINEVFDSAVGDHCRFDCPDSITPTQNKFYTLQNQGCRNFGIEIDTEYLPSLEIEKCCNEQNSCYGICKKDKELCDVEFKRCLYKFCDTCEQKTGSELIVKGCKASANILFKATLALGCKSYIEEQEKACFCPAGKRKFNNNYNKYSNSNKNLPERTVRA